MTATRAITAARRLERALCQRVPIEPLSESIGLISTGEAYEIQHCWTDLRRQCGETILGHKIGLTTRAMQEQFGVYEPDCGCLWGSRFFPARDGLVEMPFGELLQPQIEAELAFLISAPLPEGPVTVDGVVGATEALAVAIEVIDSRVKDWRINHVDTIADNASFGAFTHGSWSPGLAREDLSKVELSMSLNGELVTHGVGEAALGNPARCVAWLANALRSYSVELEPGDIVLSGALAGAVPVNAGDTFTVTSEGQAALSARFS